MKKITTFALTFALVFVTLVATVTYSYHRGFSDGVVTRIKIAKQPVVIKKGVVAK